MKTHLVIGSRGSDLALWQAHFLQDSLSAIGVTSEIRIIKTQGDQIQHISLEKLEGKGFFTKEIEDALLNGSIDVAVHSHKDLPTAETPGLSIAAVSYREDPSELLLIRKEVVDSKQFWQLPQGAKVGTSSARRVVQLKFFRPDIQCVDIRGNVPTRVQKLRDGNFDAIVLAAAGVERLKLNIDDLHAIKISPQHFIPAPAQGVLAYQCRQHDADVKQILAKLHQPDVAEGIAVERRVMQLFNGGCHMPLGVFCRRENNAFHAWAVQTESKEIAPRRMYVSGENAEALAESIFQKLQRANHKRILFTTDEASAQTAIQIVEAAGNIGLSQSFVDISPLPFQYAGGGDWLFFTSKNGVRAFFNVVMRIPAQVKIAAFGQETAQQLMSMGQRVDFIGDGHVQHVAAQFKSLSEGKHIIFPSALHARTALREAISGFAQTTVIPVYQNTVIAQQPTQADIIACTSPMQAEGYLNANPGNRNELFVAIGDTTAAYLKERGISNIHIAPQTTLMSMAELICGLI